MQKIIGILALALVCSGCFGHRASQPVAEEVSTPLSTATTPEETPAAPAPAPVEQVKQTVTTTSKSTAAPAGTQPASPKTTQSPVAKETTPTSPADLSTSTTLPTNLPPVPDKAVFKDEKLIPLQERKLGPLAALEPQSDTSFPAPWKGEQLKFGLYYSGVKVGTAYIKNRGLVEVNGQQAYVIQTSAFSASVIDKVFKVRDINLSWLDAQNFYSLGYSQSLREGNYRRDEWIIFDYPTNTYHGELTKKSGTRALSGPLTAPVLDVLTALYFVRGQNLENKKDVVFDIINREEQYPLVVKVIKRETVKTPAGKFKCIVVEPQFRGEGIFVSKGKSLQVWLTDDERKLPVKMKAEVFIGSVNAQLLEYQRN